MWTRQTLERYSVDTRQFIDFRLSTLDGGQRLVEAYNSSGLTFTLLPDRGLDIWGAWHNGLALTWFSQGSPHAPDSGQAWLRQFNGGLLTTCGLTHVGPPETDPETGEFRDLHGRYTRLRADDLRVTRHWVADGGVERYVVELSAVVAEARLFGEQLRLERTYRLTLGEPSVEIFDTVTNVGDLPTPFMLLYHFNVGYPLVAEGARLHSASAAVYPRDDAARPGFSRWPDYDAPTPRYAEQVFFHQVKAGADGWSEVALLRGDVGLAVGWDTRTLPYLTQWKNTRQGIYVSGIEPGNCLPEGRNAARNKGRLVTLEPGAAQSFATRLTALWGAEAVQQAQQRIQALDQHGVAVAACRLDDFKG